MSNIAILNFAAQSGKPWLVQTFLALGADPHSQVRTGQTPTPKAANNAGCLRVALVLNMIVPAQSDC